MKLITKAELDLLVGHNALETVHLAVAESGRWFVAFHVKKMTGKIEVYRIMTQRHEAREWSNVARLLRFIEREYQVTAGTFSTKAGQAPSPGNDGSQP